MEEITGFRSHIDEFQNRCGHARRPQPAIGRASLTDRLCPATPPSARPQRSPSLPGLSERGSPSSRPYSMTEPILKRVIDTRDHSTSVSGNCVEAHSQPLNGPSVSMTSRPVTSMNRQAWRSSDRWIPTRYRDSYLASTTPDRWCRAPAPFGGVGANRVKPPISIPFWRAQSKSP